MEERLGEASREELERWAERVLDAESLDEVFAAGSGTGYPDLGNQEALSWFPAGCYPPALPFLGSPPPSRPPSPTRHTAVLESGEVERGEIPVVEIAVRQWQAVPASTGTWWHDEPRIRGQPS